MSVPEYGWYAHMEWDVVRACWKVFLTHKQYGAEKRHLVHFTENGQMILKELDGSRDIEPTFSGHEAGDIIVALIDGAKRGGFLPDTESALKSELAGVKGEMSYAKQIVDRLLSHVLAPSED